MREREAIVKVFRYDPIREEKPKYHTYRVPYMEGDRILDVLIYIRENIDPTLAFRYSCRLGDCLTCHLKVNGRLVLPCRRAAEKNMTLEPWNKYLIVKDLIVDLKLPQP